MLIFISRRALDAVLLQGVGLPCSALRLRLSFYSFLNVRRISRRLA